MPRISKRRVLLLLDRLFGDTIPADLIAFLSGGQRLCHLTDSVVLISAVLCADNHKKTPPCWIAVSLPNM